MCHLLFAFPVIGLLAFALFPLPEATAIYLVVLVISAVMFVLMIRSQLQPVAVGLEGLVGGTGEVTAVQERWRHGSYLVRYRGELWSASSEQQLEVGEKVKVKSLRGNRLIVEGL